MQNFKVLLSILGTVNYQVFGLQLPFPKPALKKPSGRYSPYSEFFCRQRLFASEFRRRDWWKYKTITAAIYQVLARCKGQNSEIYELELKTSTRASLDMQDKIVSSRNRPYITLEEIWKIMICQTVLEDIAKETWLHHMFHHPIKFYLHATPATLYLEDRLCQTTTCLGKIVYPKNQAIYHDHDAWWNNLI